VLADGTNTYTWNAESQITKATGVNYTYDGDGDRVQKSNGKIYWYGAGSEILDESDSSGNITDEYIFFGGKRIAHRVVSGNAIYYYAEDFLGSSRVMTTATGTVCYDADFYPYGGERVVTNTCPQNYKFTGKERDAETSNDDFGARYYSSQFGRWISPDWSAIPAPVPYANLTNPQTLNLYAMVHNNPETLADFDGHCPNCVAAGIGAVAGAAIGAGSEYVGAKLAHREVTGKELLGAALKGAATGAAAGFTAGASLLATSAAVGGANVLGGIADRSVRGDAADKIFSGKEVAKDAVSGIVGGAVAAKAEGAVQGFSTALGTMAKTTGAMTAEDAATLGATSTFISNNQGAIATAASNATDFGQGVAQSFFDSLKSSQNQQQNPASPQTQKPPDAQPQH
jgi:RHS repeat-associated protein